MPTKECQRCKQPFEVTEDESVWKTMCKKCFAITQKEKEQKPIQKSFQNGNEYKKADTSNLEESIRDVLTICGRIENEFNIKFTTEDIEKFATTLFIQRSKR